MLFKQCNFMYRYHRLIIKQKNNLLLFNNTRICSTTVNSKKNVHKFDGPSLKDFIAKDLPKEQEEFINNEDKVPYVDTDDFGQNRKGKQFKKYPTTLYNLKY